MVSIVHEGLYIFFIISRSFFLRIRNASDKISTEIPNTHFMFNNFFSENCAIDEKMWKKMVQPDRPQMAIHTSHALGMLGNRGYRRARTRTLTHTPTHSE
jgi:hypothetical protein